MRRNESSFFLVTALILLTAMLAFGATTLTRSTTDLYGSSRSVATHRAFHLAEAAVDAVMTNIQGGQFDNLLIAQMTGGNYWATVDPVAALTYRIHGHGLLGSDQRDLEAIVRVTPHSVFDFALFGSEHLIVSGEAITDSFDSGVGAYDPDAPGNNGDIGTNSTASGSVNVSGTIAINGQIAVGAETGDPSTVVVISGGSALITGQPPIVPQSTPLAMPQVTVPDGLSCTDLSVTGNTTLLLPSALGQHCFNNLTVSGGATLTADGPVTVYVTGAFTASGNTVIGVASDPSAMIILLVSSQQATIESSLTGSSAFYGGLYAPSATITIDGNAQVFGSVVAQGVTISGDAQVHYDEALGELTDPIGRYDTTLLSWYEP